MAIVISDVRSEPGAVDGDVVVGSGGNLTVRGQIRGTLTVAAGGYALVRGQVKHLVVQSGGRAQLDGMCIGDASNLGGELVIRGTVGGATVGPVSD